ncbi:TMEM14 family protein [Candidatus Falkowbacteria bacterium]|nr:TMEM14 family protein [Candidatus Falkowbacteria bacterium]
MKKIFLLFALIILFFPTTSLLAGDSPMGTNCKNDDDCAVGMCMDSDIDLPEDNFCVCGNATDCEKTYGKDQGETWTCNVPNDTSNDLAYCKSDTKGIQSPFSVGQIAAQKAKEAAGGDDSKQMPYPLQPPKINVPFDTLQPFSTAMVTPGEAVSIPWMAQYIIAVYRYAIIIGSILAVIVIMIGGILYLTAGGIPNNVKKAGSLIFGAIIGLVLLLSSHLILNTINPNLTQLSTLSIGTIKGVEFPDENYKRS